MYSYKKAFSILLILFLTASFSLFACNDVVKRVEKIESQPEVLVQEKQQLLLGAEQLELLLPLLKNKNVGITGNHSTLIGKVHLVDSLLALKVAVKKVYSPEHGFRGDADAGEKVNSSVDSKTGLPIFSLYGKNKKPSNEMLEGIDVMIFDIQDVGARFYTYISTLHYVMEACAENNIQVIVLDRPNPNGYYIDGPILETDFSSFVGMHPIPVVHGMTIAEYAKMINGEKWLKNKVQADLKVISMKGYSHKDRYELPVKPSPNLPNMDAIYLYPSLCFFEGTPVSIGRGTDKPFQLFGHPSFKMYSFTFTPKAMFGAKEPRLKGVNCYGRLLTKDAERLKGNGMLDLQWLIDGYNQYSPKEEYFTNFFLLLAGTKQLEAQIKSNMTAEQIRASWKPGLEKFQKEVRGKYLMYEDF
jgi:uncharacterized protein YbbC (DUF1343 family)